MGLGSVRRAGAARGGGAGGVGFRSVRGACRGLRRPIPQRRVLGLGSGAPVPGRKVFVGHNQRLARLDWTSPGDGVCGAQRVHADVVAFGNHAQRLALVNNVRRVGSGGRTRLGPTPVRTPEGRRQKQGQQPTHPANITSLPREIQSGPGG